MAETLSSAVAQEAVHHVVHKLKETYEHSSTFTAKKSIERMEMAHIRLEAALEASRQWSISSAPLLRWRSKLKRATQECDHTLRRCKRRLQEEKESYSLPSVVARAAMSLVSSIFGHGGDEEVGGSASAMRRFEWFADSASEFLRYVEIGGSTPWRFVFFDSALVRHLLEGKGTKNCFVHGGQHLSFVLQPFSASECGMECTLIFSHKDGDAPEDNFLLSLNLRLSESTNIIGVVVRCMELFAPHLSSTAEAVKTKLTQLPMQDLRWVPDAHVIPVRDEHWDNLYTIFSKWKIKSLNKGLNDTIDDDHCDDANIAVKARSHG
nr:unnamed protein product [Digitaria exilis]